MAAVNNLNDDEFKLPLRQWLTKKIDKGQHEGLEWVDDNKQCFKIPWTQKGYPEWEKHYGIFIAWARHRGNYKEHNPPDYKKLKGNFRCALNKSDDFEEIKEASKTNRQTGNYKMFKLLSPNQVKAKRESRKRPHPKSSRVLHDSTDMPEQKKPSENHPQLNMNPEERSSNPQNLFNLNPMSMLNEPTQQYNMDISGTLPPNILMEPQCNSLSLQPPLPVEESGFNQLNIQPLQPEQFDDIDCDLAMLEKEGLMLSPSPFVQPDIVELNPVQNVDSQSQFNFQSLEDFLEKFSISGDQLSDFTVTIRYAKDTVFKQTLNFSKGFRILHGDPNKQQAILNAVGKHIDDFNFSPFVLPQYCGGNRYIPTILQSADSGLLLKTDSRGSLYGTRLCQSQVFYFDNNQPGGSSIKMDRQVRTEIFSYAKYIKRLIESHRDGVDANSDCDIQLAIGTKPKNIRSSTLVSIILEPVVAPQLKEHFNGSSTSLLAISQQNSLDQIIRMLDDFDMNMREFDATMQ